MRVEKMVHVLPSGNERELAIALPSDTSFSDFFEVLSSCCGDNLLHHVYVYRYVDGTGVDWDAGALVFHLTEMSPKPMNWEIVFGRVKSPIHEGFYPVGRMSLVALKTQLLMAGY